MGYVPVSTCKYIPVQNFQYSGKGKVCRLQFTVLVDDAGF